MDGRDAMLAVGMNGEPLPIEHGFPVRMVVPGPVRLRVGLQVDRRHRGDHLRRVRRLLGGAGLGRAAADPARRRGSTRRAGHRRVAVGDTVDDRRRRLGPARRRVARSRCRSTTGRGRPARLARGALDRHLAAVGRRPGRPPDSGQHHDPGPGHRRRAAACSRATPARAVPGCRHGLHAITVYASLTADGVTPSRLAGVTDAGSRNRRRSGSATAAPSPGSVSTRSAGAAR